MGVPQLSGPGCTMLLGLWQRHFSPCHSRSQPPSHRTDSLLQPASGSARSSHASEKSFASTSSPIGHNLTSNLNHIKAAKTPHLTLLSHIWSKKIKENFKFSSTRGAASTSPPILPATKPSAHTICILPRWSPPTAPVSVTPFRKNSPSRTR